MKIPLLSFVILQVLRIHAVVVVSPRNRTLLHHHHKRLRRAQTEQRAPDCSNELDQLESANQRLRTNFLKQKEAEKQLAMFSNAEEGEHRIDGMVSDVAREMESEALGEMLAEKWKEMRKYKLAEFVAYKKQWLLDLRKEEQVLEKQLTTAEEQKHACLSRERNGEERNGEDSAVPDELVPEELSAAAEHLDDIHDKVSPRLGLGFWEMSAEQQRSVLRGTAVYLIGGILAAILYRQVNDMYPSLFRPLYSARAEDTEDWGFHILGCFTDPKLCILGCCCPCAMWADTLGRKGLLSYWPAFAIFLILVGLTTYTHGASLVIMAAVGIYFRQRLRQRYQIRNEGSMTVALDILSWCCCSTCAIIQEAREIGVSHTDKMALTSD
jgi:Cys-rich protein (TIGR01571 family)